MVTIPDLGYNREQLFFFVSLPRRGQSRGSERRAQSRGSERRAQSRDSERRG